jgi:Mn-dependent DtxR family transcriptional regulator
MEQIQYREWTYTRDVVNFLINQRDQVASTADIAVELLRSESSVRAALHRLKKVNRVDEILPDVWHLE